MKNIENKIQELKNYLDLEESEVGEACGLLCDLHDRYLDYVDKKFIMALQKEILDQLKNFKENTKIIERTETTKTTIKELEWS